jgi:sterol desaturase/sphingolipid hydroxylase (fatty acid hydroxylase superfamily)
MRAHVTISKLLYFGDFIVIPIAMVALLALAISEGGAVAAGPLALSLGFGLFVWTFVEYVVHRFVYHHTPFFTQLHGAHHAKPLALLGFPSFVSSGLIVAAVFLPLREYSLVAASGVTSGMLLGYALYMFVHHATHHFAIQPGDVLYRARMRHMAHHYRDGCNFGVTTGFWDTVFGTTIRRGGRIAPV